MTEPVQTRKTDFNPIASRIGYSAFVMLAVYFLFFSNEPMEAAINLMLALIFDPFRRDQPFSARPLYQRAWLIVHLAVAFTLFAYAFLR